MASIGLKMPVFAPIDGEIEEGTRPTYKSGFVIGKAIKADVTINYAEATLFADDILAESDSSFQNGTIDVGVDEITLDIHSKLFGSKLVDVEGTSELHAGAKNVSPHGGFGYYKTKVINKKTKYLAKWFLDVQFKPGNDSSETKGDSTSFVTPEFSGTIFCIPGLEEDTYAEEAFFDTEADAKAWLKGKANITASRVAVQNVSAPVTTSTTTSVTPKSGTTSLSTSTDK